MVAVWQSASVTCGRPSARPAGPRRGPVARLRRRPQRRPRLLTDAFADGRLDREEYDERTAATLQARTLGQLPALVSDLVPDRPLLPGRLPLRGRVGGPPEAGARRSGATIGARPSSASSGQALVIWTSGPSSGRRLPVAADPERLRVLNLMRVAANRGEIVAAEVKRLERKQAKEIEARNKKNQTGPWDEGLEALRHHPSGGAADRTAARRPGLPVPRLLDRWPRRDRRRPDGRGLPRGRRGPADAGAVLGGAAARPPGDGLRRARGGASPTPTGSCSPRRSCTRRSTSTSPTR